MSALAFELQKVSKQFDWFQLDSVSLQLEQGQIMGLVGPNGAGKSTSIRLLMGLLQPDAGKVITADQDMSRNAALARRDIAYVADSMGLYLNASVIWHINFVRSMVPQWDELYAKRLLSHFNIKTEQTVRSLSSGERTKLLLLMALARRPRLLVLDEPTTGLDPVARHEVMQELSDVLLDDNRSVLFSSHNTRDVEQISDQITFIDRGRVVDSQDKETFLEQWRRLQLEVPADWSAPCPDGITELVHNGHSATVTTNRWSPELVSFYESTGARFHSLQRMNLEEIFIASVMYNRAQYPEVSA